MNALIFDEYELLKHYCGGGANTSSSTRIDFAPLLAHSFSVVP